MVIHPSRQRNPPLLMRWPWLLVGVAWAIAVLATLTGQRLLIDHHFLLEESGLAWPLAAAIFLVGWQVMIAAMMAPSSIPTVMPRVKAALIAGRGGPHPQRVLAVFFVGYAGAWTAFRIARLFGRHPDTPDSRCVAVARGAQLFDWRHDIRSSWPIPIQPMEGYLSCPLSAPTHGLRRRPPSQCGSWVAAWYAARRRLYWLLLGADAYDVRHRRGKSRLDGGPDRRHARRSDDAQ